MTPTDLPATGRANIVGSRTLVVRVGGVTTSLPIATIAGFAGLLVAAALQIAGPASWIPVVLGGASAVLIGFDSRFGALGGGLIVLLALPFGRAADAVPVEFAGLPVRPHDAAIAAAILATFARGRGFRIRHRAPLAVLAAFIVIGALALIAGLSAGHDLRDVGRDLRWWLLYGTLALALVGGAARRQLVTSYVVGAALFGVVVLSAATLPAFEGGLKSEVLIYDRGLLRLQFGNSAFILPVIALTVYRQLLRPRPAQAALLVLLVATIVLSLTRMSIMAMFGMIVLVMVGAYVWPHPTRHRPSLPRASLALLLSAVAAIGAIGLDIVATPRQTDPATSAGNPTRPSDPIDRVLFQDDETSFGASAGVTGGRFTTYRNAIDLIVRSPVIGHGLGKLVEVPFAYNTTRARTISMQPGVDNAYLTVAIKAGLVGAAAFAMLLAIGAWRAIRGPARGWLGPAWAGLLILTITQSFAVTSYGAFALSLLLGLSLLGYRSSKGRTAASQV